MIRRGIGIGCGILTLLCALPFLRSMVQGMPLVFPRDAIVCLDTRRCRDWSPNSRYGLYFGVHADRFIVEYHGATCRECGGGLVVHGRSCRYYHTAQGFGAPVLEKHAEFHVPFLGYEEWSLYGLPFRTLTVSYLIPGTGAGAIALALWIIPWARGSSRRPRNGCTRCGYDLTGNVSGVCPECGTPVATGIADGRAAAS